MIYWRRDRQLCDNRGITRSQKVRDAAWFELGAGQVMHGGHGSVSLLAGKAVSASRGEIGHRGGRPQPRPSLYLTGGGGECDPLFCKPLAGRTVGANL